MVELSVARSDSHWKNTTTCSLKRMIWSLKVHIQSEYFDIQFSTRYITFDVNSSRLAVSIAFIYMQKNMSHALCMPAPSLSLFFFLYFYIYFHKKINNYIYIYIYLCPRKNRGKRTRSSLILLNQFCHRTN